MEGIFQATPIIKLNLINYSRPLRDDEVLPVRQHRVVPAASADATEDQKEVPSQSCDMVM